jgi:hypothetical protein
MPEECCVLPDFLKDGTSEKPFLQYELKMQNMNTFI